MPRKITLAAPYTDRDGKTHKADTTLEVPSGVASRLLLEGLAREPKSAETKPATQQSKTSEKGA